jgi:NTP pyrophosphatase (non-canonical NTP hydrolase)
MPPLDFARYQEAAAVTGGAVRVDHSIVYPTLGLTNEAREVAGKVKKILRDHGGVITEDDRAALTLELGDVLGYLSELCTQLGISLEGVASKNIEKLRGRQARGTLGGDGDSR